VNSGPVSGICLAAMSSARSSAAIKKWGGFHFPGSGDLTAGLIMIIAYPHITTLSPGSLLPCRSSICTVKLNNVNYTKPKDTFLDFFFRLRS
jgi:hypothetical protein